MRISESSALSAPQLVRLAPVGKERTANVGDGSNDRRTNLIEALDRGDSMTSLATTQPGEHLQQPISRDVSVAPGLLDRDDLLQMLDRAVTKRVTVISAPPGSGKTSLLPCLG